MPEPIRENYKSLPPISTETNNEPIQLGYLVVAEYPHDSAAFTQGLEFVNGRLYESTGLYGQSSLRENDLETGNVLRREKVLDKYFAEGLTVIGNKIYQLTWQSGIGFIYDRETFALLDEFAYTTEGWGMTYNGQHVIMSDGTDQLYFYTPEEFILVKIISVTRSGEPQDMLNELEFINQSIFANIWKSDEVVRIDPETGEISHVIDFSGLLSPEDSGEADVLNGIAYDSQNDRLFVTGKWWPKIFHVELSPLVQ